MLKQRTLHPIRMLILGLTGECNFACVYCYANEHPQEYMSLVTACQAVDLAASGGQPFVLQFSGGEPLLAFDAIKEIVAYVKQKKLPAIMQIQTNASLMDHAKAVFLRDHQIGVGISLDGRPTQNDELRKLPDGSGTSRLILAGAATLASVGVETGITCVVADSNVRHLHGIVEIAYYLGNVRKIGFDLLRAQGRGVGIKAVDAADLKRALQQVLTTAGQLARQTGRALIFSHRERVESLCGQCDGGFTHCHAMNGEAAFVNAIGEIYACASLSGFPVFRLGHVDTGIDPGQMQTIREMIQGSMAFCPACESFALCGGGCFARWYGAGCVAGP
ncbi:MAG: radical SAM protein [Negativicutes bacterium]